MRLILLGPPGCGKGTQAKLLCQRNGLEHIGTGDILREAIRQHTPAGCRAQPFVESGKLVPDDLVNDVIAERFNNGNPPERFVMDGYPRTIAQASFFDQLLREQGLDLDGVIFLEVPDEEVTRRLSGRRICPNATCAASYHITLKPPRQTDVCDLCGTRLVHRDDDKPETIAKRLQIYHAVYDELVEQYRRSGLLKDIPGVGAIETVYDRIVKALKPC